MRNSLLLVICFVFFFLFTSISFAEIIQLTDDEGKTSYGHVDGNGNIHMFNDSFGKVDGNGNIKMFSNGNDASYGKVDSNGNIKMIDDEGNSLYGRIVYQK